MSGRKKTEKNLKKSLTKPREVGYIVVVNGGKGKRPEPHRSKENIMSNKIFISDNANFGESGWFNSREEWENAVRECGYDPAEADPEDCHEVEILPGCPHVAVEVTKWGVYYYRLYPGGRYSNIDAPVFMMKPRTGVVNLAEEWAEDEYLFMVVPNIPGLPGYDPDAGDWRDPGPLKTPEEMVSAEDYFRAWEGISPYAPYGIETLF